MLSPTTKVFTGIQKQAVLTKQIIPLLRLVFTLRFHNIGYWIVNMRYKLLPCVHMRNKVKQLVVSVYIYIIIM